MNTGLYKITHIHSVMAVFICIQHSYDDKAVRCVHHTTYYLELKHYYVIIYKL